jgi:hypothetical protein
LLRPVLVLLVAALAALVAAEEGLAADPIMPLSDVRAGMTCTGLSVVRGTDISEFDVEVIDVLAAEAPLSGPRILIRVSGPAVDATGIGPGFSGSPIYCPDGTGTQRNAGAISEGVGDYGNHVALATPIEEILTDRPAPTPSGARSPGQAARSARPLVGPLTVSGVAPRTLRLLSAAAHRAGRPLLAAPSGPAGGFGQVELRPGAAVAASLSDGDVALGAIGTVAYRDGDAVYAFGHPLDLLGRRALFLQDAYVFSVINNPLGVPDLGAVTYKLTSSGGHTQGAITTDADAAISGNVGAEPPSIPLRVVVRGSGGGVQTLDARLADERALGLGAGLAGVAPLAAGTALERLLRSLEPVTMSMCARFSLAGRDKPLGFCNRYFFPDQALFELSEAAALVDGYDIPPLPLTGMEVRMRVAPGVKRDVILRGSAPRRVKRGQRIAVRLSLHRRRGEASSRVVHVRVPRSLRPGRHRLVIQGTGEGSFDAFAEELIEELGFLFGEEGSGRREPHSIRQLAARLREFHRPQGITARFRKRDATVVYRSADVLFEGRARIPLIVSRRR